MVASPPAEPKRRPLLRHPIAELRARRAVLDELEHLDPEVDNHGMTQLVVGRVFCDALFVDALFTVAYWRQIAVRTIAPILHQNGRGQTYDTSKRVDDTLLFFGFMYRDGSESERGGATIDRLAAIHERFKIRADDFRYTASSLCFEAVRIPEILGVDGLTAREARAMFVFWRGVARRWGIDVPEEQAEFRAWMEEYERTEYERTPEGLALAVAMGDDFCRRFFPGPLKPIGYTVLRCLSDDHLLDTVGQPRPTAITRKAVALLIGAYLRARRTAPASAENRFLGSWTKLYGREPTPEEVGPEWSQGITAASRRHKHAGVAQRPGQRSKLRCPV